MTSEPKITIAFCVTELESGGAERMLVELVTGLDRAVFEPTVIALGSERRASGPLLARLAAAGVPVRFLGARSWLEAPRIYFSLRRVLAQLRPALVQTWLWHGNVLGGLAASSLKIPLVTGLRVAEPTRPWRLTLERLATRGAATHVAVSDGVKQFAIERIRLPAEKIVVVPNGVAVELNGPTADLTQFGVAPSRRAIAFVGRLDRQKGIDWLIELAPSLLHALPDHDLLIAGAGPLEAHLKRRVSELKLAGQVRLIGPLPDARPLMRAADLLLLTSRWEGMPNVALEAMACGKPIVATDVAGVRELLGDGPQITPPGDAAQFIERAASILSSPSLALSLGAANAQRVAEHFSLPRMIAAYSDLYLKIAAKIGSESTSGVGNHAVSTARFPASLGPSTECW